MSTARLCEIAARMNQIRTLVEAPIQSKAVGKNLGVQFNPFAPEYQGTKPSGEKSITTKSTPSERITVLPQQVTQPSANPVIQPSANPVIRPSAKPVIQPSAKPVIQPSAKNTGINPFSPKPKPKQTNIMPTTSLDKPIQPINNYFSRATTSRQTRSGALNEANYNRVIPEDNKIGWTATDEAAVQKDLSKLQLSQLQERLSGLQQQYAAAKGNQQVLRGIVKQVTNIRNELLQIQNKNKKQKQKSVGPLSLTSPTERATLEKEAPVKPF
jgi:hypothetical protein